MPRFGVEKAKNRCEKCNAAILISIRGLLNYQKNISHQHRLSTWFLALIDSIMVGSRVYVGGLPYGTRERDLEKFFKGYGRTRDILIKNGYGFVEFEDYRDADDAVYELNGKELLGERSVLDSSIYRYKQKKLLEKREIHTNLFHSPIRYQAGSWSSQREERLEGRADIEIVTTTATTDAAEEDVMIGE